MTDYRKYADSEVRRRALETGLSRLWTAAFVAALGPLGTGVIHLLSLTPGPWARWGILASAPLGVLLAIVNYARLPEVARARGRANRILLLTFVLAGATLLLAVQFSLV